MEVTKAWVRIPTMRVENKQMTSEEVKEICSQNNLGIWNGERLGVVSASDFEVTPVTKTIYTYGMPSGSYETSPSITLVPIGTTVSYGMFKYPNE